MRPQPHGRLPGDDDDGICDNCGAHKEAGLATCKYCGRPFIVDLERRAVPCHQCRSYCDWGALTCAKCGADVVRQCLMCRAISPHHLCACMKCGDPFAGQAQRLDAQRKQQQIQTAAKIGDVALSAFGVRGVPSLGDIFKK